MTNLGRIQHNHVVWYNQVKDGFKFLFSSLDPILCMLFIRLGQLKKLPSRGQ